jgi:hypothetical protein
MIGLIWLRIRVSVIVKYYRIIANAGDCLTVSALIRFTTRTLWPGWESDILPYNYTTCGSVTH